MTFGKLENDILLLNPLLENDFNSLFQVASDPQIWEQHPDYTRYTLDGFTVYFEHLLNTNRPYLIYLKENNELIGATSFYQYDEINKSIAIGYTFLAKKYWGGKVNSSVKQLLMDHAFNSVDTIIFHVREKNYRSQAALQKIGAIKFKEYPSPSDPDSLQLEYIISKNSR